jgi:hypothetical protein
MPYDKKISYYCCVSCHKIQDKIRHQNDKEYNKKQRDRYTFRKSAVIFAYGNQCSICQEDDYEKLTISCKGKKPTNLYHYLYNNVVDKDTFNVICYNCKIQKYVKNIDKYALRDKELVISHYGGYCLSCKEGNTKKLMLYRTEKNRSGNALYKWIINNNYPPGFQIYCINCLKYKQELQKLLELSRHESIESVSV